MLLGCVVGIVRTMFFYTPEPLVLVAWGVLTLTFLGAAMPHRPRPMEPQTFAPICTDNRPLAHVRRRLDDRSRTPSGPDAPGDPKSMFNAFFVFVFYVACIAWTLDSRIGAAELAAREQSLRLECRLADLAEKLQSYWEPIARRASQARSRSDAADNAKSLSAASCGTVIDAA